MGSALYPSSQREKWKWRKRVPIVPFLLLEHVIIPLSSLILASAFPEASIPVPTMTSYCSRKPGGAAELCGPCPAAAPSRPYLHRSVHSLMPPKDTVLGAATTGHFFKDFYLHIILISIPLTFFCGSFSPSASRSFFDLFISAQLSDLNILCQIPFFHIPYNINSNRQSKHQFFVLLAIVYLHSQLKIHIECQLYTRYSNLQRQ